MEIIFNPEVKNTSLTCMSSSGSTCFFFCACLLFTTAVVSSRKL